MTCFTPDSSVFWPFYPVLEWDYELRHSLRCGKIGFVLWETGRLCRNEKYVEGMKKCIRLLDNKATITDKVMGWTDVTDIISGNTGIGLFLLYASENFGVEEAESV